jgi:hypothetical protein
MEDKEVLENYNDNSNSDKDSSQEIKRLDDRINKLKDLITKEYKEKLLEEIENRLNFEKLKDTSSIIKESSNKIQSLSLELNNLKEEDIPNILKSLEEIVDEKFKDLKNNEINEFKEKYEIIENNSNLAKENSDKIQDLKLETDNLKVSILTELGEKINGLDGKYLGTIENLKNNEISKLDTKYSEVLGKFDNLKDDIIKEKDKRIDDKEKELQEVKKSNMELNQKLEKEIEDNKNQVDCLNKKLEELEIKDSSSQVKLKNLEEQLTEKKEDIKTKVEELERLKVSNIELNQKLEIQERDNRSQVEGLNEKLKGLELENNSNKAKLANLENELNQKEFELKELKVFNNTLNEKLEFEKATKEDQVHNLKEKMEKEKIENESLIGELKIKLNNFYDKIEKPYENLLKAITESTKADTIGNYLGFNNEKGLSKSMILFALASDDNLARRIALFYSERKEIMVEEDFRIVKEVNDIYVNKPWGILYAEAEGPYQSSLVKDRKSSSIYKNFVAMYSPAYRPDENGNSPIKGIVDGK